MGGNATTGYYGGGGGGGGGADCYIPCSPNGGAGGSGDSGGSNGGQGGPPAPVDPGSGGGGVLILAAREVLFTGRADLGNGVAAVYGRFLDLGSFSGRAPEVFPYGRWAALPALDFYVGAGSGGGGAGGDGQEILPGDRLAGYRLTAPAFEASTAPALPVDPSVHGPAADAAPSTSSRLAAEPQRPGARDVPANVGAVPTLSDALADPLAS
jgi:hypothetical protein